MKKIAIVSGKGGAGKTFIATHLFKAAQDLDISACLIDADAEEPNATIFLDTQLTDYKDVTTLVPTIETKDCTFCKRCYDYCNYNAIVFAPQQNYIEVIESLCHNCGACVYACHDNAITEHTKKIGTIRTFTHKSNTIIEGKTEIGTASPVPVIHQTIASAPICDIALIDSPPGISCPCIAAVSNADMALLVVEATRFGLHDAKLTAAMLKDIHKPIVAVINKDGIGTTDVSTWLQQENIPLLGSIPFSKNIAHTYAEGSMTNDYTEIFTSIVTSILN